MQQADQQQMTVEEICEQIGANPPSVKKALAALNLVGRRDMADRRRVVYPAGSAERVRQWLIDNS